jgi:hypothetical protein
MPKTLESLNIPIHPSLHPILIATTRRSDVYNPNVNSFLDDDDDNDENDDNSQKATMDMND